MFVLSFLKKKVYFDCTQFALPFDRQHQFNHQNQVKGVLNSNFRPFSFELRKVDFLMHFDLGFRLL